jgi:hypothetical protein
MFVWQHILSAIILTIVISRFTTVSFSALLIVLVLAQAIDVDHYSGDLSLLVRCGLQKNYEDRYHAECMTSLHKGFFHTIYFVGVLYFSTIFLLVMGYKFESFIVAIFLMGVLMHLILDSYEIAYILPYIMR